MCARAGADTHTRSQIHNTRTRKHTRISRDWLSVWQSASTETDKARLTAIRAQHSSDWLFALPISASGLRLGDEAIRVTVGLRLGLNICEPHTCPCGANVDARGLHGLACKRSARRSTRHQQLNDLIWRALKRADISSTKERTGLLRGDGKRPDGLTLVPWQAGKCLTWDATVVDTLASSYVSVTATRVGGAADAAADRKSLKYASITNQTHFRASGDRNAWTHLFTRLVVLGGDKQSSCHYLRRHTRNFLFISKGLSFNTAFQSDCFPRHLHRWEWHLRLTTPDLILT